MKKEKIKRSLIRSRLDLLRNAAKIKFGPWHYAVTRNIKYLTSAFKNLQNAYNTRLARDLEAANKLIEEKNKELKAKKKKALPLLDLTAFDEGHDKLIKKHSKYTVKEIVKENGKDVEKEVEKMAVHNGQVIVHQSNIEAYEKEAAALNKKLKREEEFYNKFNKEFDEYLQTDVMVDVYKVGQLGIPNDLEDIDLQEFDFMLND